MNTPNELKYTKDHEWTKIEGNTATIGITDHAQSSLGDVVFVELPVVGRELKEGETFGVVESIKAVSDLYSPISGKVVARNEELIANPASTNTDPYTKAWMIKVELAPGALDAAKAHLMDAVAYDNLVKNL